MEIGGPSGGCYAMRAISGMKIDFSDEISADRRHCDRTVRIFYYCVYAVYAVQVYMTNEYVNQLGTFLVEHV